MTRSLPRRDPQMQIFRCICLNRVDLRPFSSSYSPSISNTTHALPFLCFSSLSLFFFLPQTNVLRLVSYPPCRLLFYLKPEFSSVRARVQIYSKTVQLSRRSNTPVKIRADRPVVLSQIWQQRVLVDRILTGQRWRKFNSRSYE